MSSKRWVCRFLAVVFALLGTLAVINYLIDPKGRWGNLEPPVRPITREGLSIKFPAFLASDATCVFMGSSRVNLLQFPDEISGMRVASLSISGSSMAHQLTALRKYVLKRPVRRIYLGLDFEGFFGAADPLAAAYLLPGRWPLDESLRELISFETTQRSWRAWRHGEYVAPQMRLRFEVANGRGIRAPFRESEHEQARMLAMVRNYIIQSRETVAREGIAPSFATFDAFLQEAAAADIEVVFFICPVANTLLEVYREEAVWPLILTWKRELARRGPVVDLLREWSEEDQIVFFDCSHVAAEHSDFILRHILPEKGEQPSQ